MREPAEAPPIFVSSAGNEEMEVPSRCMWQACIFLAQCAKHELGWQLGKVSRYLS